MKRKKQIPILETAILEMARMKKNEFFDPVEVIQWIFPQDWKYFVLDLAEEVEKLYKEGKIKNAEQEELVFPLKLQTSPIQIAANV